MERNVDIRLARERLNMEVIPVNIKRAPRLYTPGEVVIDQKGFMKGHGTYVDGDQIKSSVAGVMEQVNKLISVKPLKSRYVGEIGDVVVARITKLQQKLWKVDTNSQLDSVLLLSSVNLAGGELRRRSAEDEQKMRKYLHEGDLISAMVQKVYEEGTLSLYMRSLRFGKLSQGVLVKVFPSLIKRRRKHFHKLPCGVSIILGNNGHIWIAPTSTEENDTGYGGYTQNLKEVIPRGDREVIARVRNCILALAHCKMMIYDTPILYSYEVSLKYKVEQLVQQEAILDLATLTMNQLRVLNIK